MILKAREKRVWDDLIVEALSAAQIYARHCYPHLAAMPGCIKRPFMGRQFTPALTDARMVLIRNMKCLKSVIK